MNDDKTECMPIRTRQQLAKVFLDKITVGENSIPLSQIVKNLGTLMDCNLKFHKQINSLCKLDYCNSILYGLPAYRIAKLPRVQNTAARLVYLIPKFAHISPYLKELHWLPVKFRIEFKITILTFHAFHGLAPKYLCELVRIKEQSTYHLRSSEEIMLMHATTRKVFY